MKATCYAHTDPGNKRPQNEDYYLVDEELGLFVVCDGVGGHVAGAMAAEMSARAIRQVVHDGRAIMQAYAKDKSLKNRSICAGLLQKAIFEANAKIHQMAEVDVVKKGMCTTSAALLLLDDYAILGHVGDSRIYLHRGDQIHQLTEDHRYSVEMLKRGILTAEEAARSPQSNVLTRAVGIQPTVQVDLLQIEVMSGDTFLVCSDGVHSYFDKNDLKAQFSADVQKLPDQIVKTAKQRGGADNITAVVVKIDEAKEAKSDVVDVMKKTEILGKIPIFRYMTYPEITKILAISHAKQFKKGSIVLKEGDASDEMHIIASGMTDVVKGQTKVAQRGKGEVFGEMGIFDNAPRSATVAAAEDVISIAIHRKDLLQLLRQESQIAVKLLWAINSELNAKLRTATSDMAARIGQPPAAPEPTQAISVPFDLPEKASLKIER